MWKVTYEAWEEMAWRQWSVAAMQALRFGLFVEENTCGGSERR